jgi:hypothetical protein
LTRKQLFYQKIKIFSENNYYVYESKNNFIPLFIINFNYDKALEKFDVFYQKLEKISID